MLTNTKETNAAIKREQQNLLSLFASAHETAQTLKQMTYMVTMVVERPTDDSGALELDHLQREALATQLLIIFYGHELLIAQLSGFPVTSPKWA